MAHIGAVGVGNSYHADQQRTGEPNSWRPPKIGPHHHARLPVVICAILAGLIILAAGWGLCAVFLSKLAVGDAKMSSRTSDEVLASSITAYADSYQLAIAYPDGTTKKFALKDMGFQLDTNASIRAAREDRRLLRWWSPVPVRIILSTDEAALDNFIAKEITLVAEKPKDASLRITNGKPTITKEVNGTQYALKEARQTLQAAADTLTAEPLRLQKLTLQPTFTEASLTPYKTRLESIIRQSLKFNIGDRTVQPSTSEVGSWITAKPDKTANKIDLSVNSDRIKSYINSITASSIRPAKAQVNVKQQDGSTKVLVAGVKGVRVVNQAGTASSVAKGLLDGKGMSFTLPVEYEAFQTITAGAYAKWIEIDITAKRLYAYNYGTLLKTYLVTAGAPSTPTVTGQFSIRFKRALQDMRGADYYQPDVAWVNYFYQDYAIHGNYWRPRSYFGNINSSHGCVGLINSEAKWVYDWAPVGTPVIVHK